MRSLLIYITLFSSFLGISGQTLDEAKEMYLLGEYSRALPIFERELKSNAQDFALNQWYGVCLYETGGNLLKVKEHIDIAAGGNIQDAFLYLGNIYAKMYRFKEAETEFAKYAKLKRRDKQALAKLEKSREMADKLCRFALRTEDVLIIDSLILDKKDILSAYKLSPGLGELHIQKSSNGSSTIFINGTNTKMYYGQKIEGKTVLFSEEKLLDGYDNPRMLSGSNFNLTGSTNFPSVLSDGVTVYFAGQDEEGVGGYDLYVTRYNLNNDTYLTPEHLSAPFNSSFNDYLLVIDEEKEVGWFASDRFQPEGKVCVYTFIPNSKVYMVEDEDEEAIIKRAYISSIADTHKYGIDYSEMISLARKTPEKKVETKRDFIFVINDKRIYYTLSDFKNEKARGLYEKSIEMRHHYDTIAKELIEKRDQYSKSSTVDKQSLSYAILDMENQLPKLHEQISKLELSARNQEIQYLNN